MGWLTVISSILTLTIKLFDLWIDHDRERTKRKKEALNEALDAIENSDVSSLNRAIGRMR